MIKLINDKQPPVVGCVVQPATEVLCFSYGDEIRGWHLSTLKSSHVDRVCRARMGLRSSDQIVFDLDRTPKDVGVVPLAMLHVLSDQLRLARVKRPVDVEKLAPCGMTRTQEFGHVGELIGSANEEPEGRKGCAGHV